ncbi:MAG TPA: DUF2127 domain-containing protein [Bryobacteraceae bacterium]|nr:DUF2127 domain-containing protein [Bryobacteraceae bacterium]
MPRTPKSRTVVLIALFKLFKGILLTVVALGTFRLVRPDLHATLARWAHAVHVDPAGRRANAVLAKVTNLTPKKLEELGLGELFYAGILLTEGIGLLLRRRWAEYFTIISTGVFIPLEIYELAERVSVPRLAVFAINVAIVWYLVARLRTTQAADRVAPELARSYLDAARAHRGQ